MNLGAITDLLRSEKGVAAGSIAVCATVMVFLDRMPVEMWASFMESVLLIYVGGKTIQGGVSVIANRKTGQAEALKEAADKIDAAADKALSAKFDDEDDDEEEE